MHSRLNDARVHVTHDPIKTLTIADRSAAMRCGVIRRPDAPRVIHNRTANLRAAGFTGVLPVNLPGATLNCGRTFCGGAHIPDPAGHKGRAVPDRPRTIPGLRPEHRGLRHDPDPGHSPPAVAGADAPAGTDSPVWPRVDHRPISGRLPVEPQLNPGTQVHLPVDMSAASFFDDATERRI